MDTSWEKPRLSYKSFAAGRAAAEAKAQQVFESTLRTIGPSSFIRGHGPAPMNYGRVDDDEPLMLRSSKSSAVIDEMADRVVQATKRYVARANVSTEARIAALEAQLMEHGPKLDAIERRLSQLELTAGA